MAKLAVPEYIASRDNLIKEAPPGHRFLLYFRGWDIENDKRDELKKAAQPGGPDRKMLKALADRQREAAGNGGIFSHTGRLTAPLATGLGNPHPVENGFSFLSPYGLPYLPGSGVKGVLRRAAEELALLDDESPWTIPLVWALFGFDATSACLTGGGDNHAEGWPEAFARWTREKADRDPLLRAWLDAVCPDRDRDPNEPERTPSETLATWCGESQAAKNDRGGIHWQGLLRFWDAFPSEAARLGVDILNPHHKEYYEGKNGNKTPHDAEQPKPVFFLVMEPGAEFRFHVEAVERFGLLERAGDWKKLLRAAFDHAFEWLGFGAKTAVGYGAMRNAAEAPPSGGGDTPGAVETATTQWEEVRLAYEPGPGTGKVQGPEGLTAVVSRETLQAFRSSLPEDLKKRLKKKKSLSNVKATIEKAGNAMVVIELKL